MSGKNVLCFKLLGSFQFREGGEAQWRSLESMGIKGVGKKQLAFLMYFLLNNKRLITAEELVETFWPGDSKDPANALKNTLHKNRTLLKTMFPQTGELIFGFSPKLKAANTSMNSQATSPQTTELL